MPEAAPGRSAFSGAARLRLRLAAAAALAAALGGTGHDDHSSHSTCCLSRTRNRRECEPVSGRLSSRLALNPAGKERMAAGSLATSRIYGVPGRCVRCRRGAGGSGMGAPVSGRARNASIT